MIDVPTGYERFSDLILFLENKHLLYYDMFKTFSIWSNFHQLCVKTEVYGQKAYVSLVYNNKLLTLVNK